MQRLFQLDYLRGLCALAIVCYHFSMWTFGPMESTTTLGRVGLYGVSIFYILSGLTLYHVYAARWELATVGTFLFKRGMRIFPILWMATLGTLWVLKAPFDGYKLLINLTGLFGFFDWGNYYATGAWSIGNELVFYWIFILLLLVKTRSVACFNALLWLCVLAFTYFSFFKMAPHLRVAAQWDVYIHPLHQLGYFAAGMGIAHFFQTQSFSALQAVMYSIVGLTVLLGFPISGGPGSIVSGWIHLYLSIACLFIVLGLYKLHVTIPRWMHHPLHQLGQISYSLYLLHPIVYFFIKQHTAYFKTLVPTFNATHQFGMSAILSILLSFITYYAIERSIIHWAGSQFKPSSPA